MAGKRKGGGAEKIIGIKRRKRVDGRGEVNLANWRERGDKGTGKGRGECGITERGEAAGDTGKGKGQRDERERRDREMGGSNRYPGGSAFIRETGAEGNQT